MTSDRKADRHQEGPGNRPRIPGDQWVSLGERVGDRERTRVVVDLVTRYLDGRPMPERPWLAGEADKPGQRHEE